MMDGSETESDTPIVSYKVTKRTTADALPPVGDDPKAVILGRIHELRSRIRLDLPRDAHPVRMAMDRLTECEQWIRDLDPADYEVR